MRNRSNLLVLLGIAFFVVGGIIVYVLTNDDDGGSSSSAGGPITVVEATRDIPAGALADDAIKSGSVKEVKIPEGQVLAGAVQSLNQLQGATFTQGFADGQQITSGGVQSLNRKFDIPDGFDAIAVQLDFVAGGAGYVNPGDHINIYGAYGPQYAIDGLTVPAAKLIVSNVQVLDVSLTVPARRGSTDTAARASSDNVTLLIAVNPIDAEKLVMTTEFESLYASLMKKDAPAPGPTPGRDTSNVINPDPNAATKASASSR